MTFLSTEPKIGEFADPRITQRRIATTPSGRRVDVPVTSEDRLRLINQLPSRWPDVIKARERGESLEQIARWAKVPPPCRPHCRSVDVKHDDRPDLAERVHEGPECLAFLMSRCYAVLETKLHELAQIRAKLMI